MIIQNTTELRILGVYDRGIPNKERIVLEALDSINLAQYGLLLAFQVPGYPAVPYQDHFFWLTEREVAPGTLVFIYTGPGEFRETIMPNTLTPVLVMHWGKMQTILANTTVVPTLIRIDAVHIADQPVNLPQLTK